MQCVLGIEAPRGRPELLNIEDRTVFGSFLCARVCVSWLPLKAQQLFSQRFW